MVRPIAIAYGRALRSQFSRRMLLLSVVPLLLSLALWGSLLYAGMQPLYDWLQDMLSATTACSRPAAASCPRWAWAS
jgi:hypothetical protein